MKTGKQFSLSEGSRLCLDALDTFVLFQEKLSKALAEMYGEKEAEIVLKKNYTMLDSVRSFVMDQLCLRFTAYMGTDAQEITI